MAGELLLRCAGLLSVCAALAATCSWSNEGCESDSECCSKSCYRMHEGTNPRCRHSTLGELCVFDYHCRDDLVCGKYFNCCSPFWKMCIKNEDCCDKSLVCRSADGFIYDRCLKPSAAQPPVRAVPRTILGALVIVSVLAHR